MLDSDDDMLTAAVRHLDDAAASLRQSDVRADQMAGLLRLIADVQRSIMVAAGEMPRQHAATSFVAGGAIH